MLVAKRQALQFDQAVERRVFDPLDFWNIHQAYDGFGVKDLPVWCEHSPQFESQHALITSARFPVDRRLFLR